MGGKTGLNVGKMYVLLHNRPKKYTKLFISAVFYIGLLGRIHSNNEVTQKGWRDAKSSKTVTRFKNFLEVSTKFENTKNSLFSVLLLSFSCWVEKLQ